MDNNTEKSTKWIVNYGTYDFKLKFSYFRNFRNLILQISR